jgi:hypothetical protein
VPRTLLFYTSDKDFKPFEIIIKPK